MQIIPLQATDNQTLTVVLDNQIVQIDVFQKAYGLFCNLWVNNAMILAAQLCQNLNRIVRDSYLGFPGDVLFLDQQGKSDPFASGLGSRFVLCWLSPADLAAGVATAGTP